MAQRDGWRRVSGTGNTGQGWRIWSCLSRLEQSRRVEQRAPMDWLNEFQTLTLRNSRVHIVHDRDGLAIILNVDSLSGRRDGDVTSLTIAAHVASTGEAGSLSLELQSDDRLQTVSINLETDALRSSRLAPPRGRLAVLKTIDVPLSAKFQAIYSPRDGLQSADLDLAVGSGNVSAVGENRPVESTVFVASLSPGDEVIQAELVVLDADRLRLSGCGVIRYIGRLYDGDIGTSPKFDLNLSDVRLDLTPIFEAPLRMRSVSALGELDLDARSLSLDRFAASFSDFSISTQARIESGDDGLKLVKLKGKTDSPLTAQNLLSLWPVKSADDVRRWIDRSVLGGSLHDVQFDVALDEVFFTAPVLTSDRLQLDFNVRDGVVRYISTMDPLTEAYGSGWIDGNRFGFVLERGRINGIEIVGDDVDIPRLMPKGGDILITTQGLGDAQSLLGLINQPPFLYMDKYFLYMDKYGVDPEGFSGTADVTLSIKTALAGIL